MRAAYLALLGMVVGLTGAGATFFAQGRLDSQGWRWLSDPAGQAWWRFYGLSWEGQHLSVEILVQTRGWRTPPPTSLSLTFRFSTLSSSLTRRLQLQRVTEKGEHVTYFGQAILARRDLKLGSYLAVELVGGPVGIEIGVHENSVRVQGEWVFTGEAGGTGGPLVPAPSDPKARSPSSPAISQLNPGSAPEGKTVRECAGMEDAPYVSPGHYVCTLGWPGPGEALDSRDWFRVNLGLGYFLEVQINSPQAIRLSILDPSGQEVGWVGGAGRIGLSYQAPKAGVYWICVSLIEGIPLFTYTVDLAIRR
ncbi:MAG: hypothetical protein ACP5LJ_02050 [Candidatus Bipolaricaulaceae bacterium]